MGSISRNLVAKTLRRNDGDLVANSLVGLEVESQLRVVSLDDDLCGLLDGLGTNATHVCGILDGICRGGSRGCRIARNVVVVGC